jgi:hypothetical protein
VSRLLLDPGDLRRLLPWVQGRILEQEGYEVGLGLESLAPLRLTVRVHGGGGRVQSLLGRFLSSGLALGGTPVLRGQALFLRWEGPPVRGALLEGLAVLTRWRHGRLGNDFLALLPDHRIRIDLHRIPLEGGRGPGSLLGARVAFDRVLLAADGLELHFHFPSEA